MHLSLRAGHDECAKALPTPRRPAQAYHVCTPPASCSFANPGLPDCRFAIAGNGLEVHRDGAAHGVGGPIGSDDGTVNDRLL
jgi:hypothetical protein